MDLTTKFVINFLMFVFFILWENDASSLYFCLLQTFFSCIEQKKKIDRK